VRREPGHCNRRDLAAPRAECAGGRQKQRSRARPTAWALRGHPPSLACSFAWSGSFPVLDVRRLWRGVSARSMPPQKRANNATKGHELRRERAWQLATAWWACASLPRHRGLRTCREPRKTFRLALERGARALADDDFLLHHRGRRRRHIDSRRGRRVPHDDPFSGLAARVRDCETDDDEADLNQRDEGFHVPRAKQTRCPPSAKDGRGVSSRPERSPHRLARVLACANEPRRVDGRHDSSATQLCKPPQCPFWHASRFWRSRMEVSE